jgi:hypothetical protein
MRRRSRFVRTPDPIKCRENILRYGQVMLMQLESLVDPRWVINTKPGWSIWLFDNHNWGCPICVPYWFNDVYFMKAIKLLLHDWQRCITHRPSATIDWGRVLSVSVTIRVHWPSPSLKTSGKDFQRGDCGCFYIGCRLVLRWNCITAYA